MDRLFERPKVCAVIPTFKPDLTLLDHGLKALSPQLDCIIVVDNGSDPDQLNWLQRQRSEQRIVLLAQGKNLGVATGHNKGIAWAREHLFDYVLLLDQDSIPAQDMVEQLLRAQISLRSRGFRISAVGPRYRNSTTGQASFFVRFGIFRFQKIHCNSKEPKQYLPVDFLISSGTLISVDSLQKIGVMEDDLFIDHIDTEWFLRAASKGYSAYGVCDAFMDHGLGQGSISIGFRKRRSIRLHPPLRNYYTFRNSVLLYKRHYAPIQWILGDLIRLSGLFILYAVLAPCRWRHIRMMFKGILDGLRNRTEGMKAEPAN